MSSDFTSGFGYVRELNHRVHAQRALLIIRANEEIK